MIPEITQKIKEKHLYNVDLHTSIIAGQDDRVRTATGDISNFLFLLQRQRDRTGHDELLENLARLRIPVEADLAVVVQTETEQFVISAGGFGGDQCETMSGGHVGHLEERNPTITQGLLFHFYYNG